MHDAIELGSKHIKDTVGGVVDAEQVSKSTLIPLETYTLL